MFILNGEEIGENEARKLIQQAGYAGANKMIVNMMSSTEGAKCQVEDGLLLWEPNPDMPVHVDGIGNAAIFDAISKERAKQDMQWGGPAHDDQHDTRDWIAYIRKQLNFAELSTAEGFRERMMKVAALAVAALESQARKLT